MRSNRINIGLTICLVMLALVLSCSLLASHPSDASLIGNFQTHKAEFNRLLQMFLADKELERVAYDFTRPQNPEAIGVTEDRLKAYRELFNELGLSAGIEGYGEKNVVLLRASTSGLSVSGSSKGYAYLKQRPMLVVDNLETYHSQGGKSFTAFRLVEANWYLYFDYED